MLRHPVLSLCLLCLVVVLRCHPLQRILFAATFFPKGNRSYLSCSIWPTCRHVLRPVPVRSFHVKVAECNDAKEVEVVCGWYSLERFPKSHNLQLVNSWIKCRKMWPIKNGATTSMVCKGGPEDSLFSQNDLTKNGLGNVHLANLW